MYFARELSAGFVKTAVVSDNGYFYWTCAGDNENDTDHSQLSLFFCFQCCQVWRFIARVAILKKNAFGNWRLSWQIIKLPGERIGEK